MMGRRRRLEGLPEHKILPSSFFCLGFLFGRFLLGVAARLLERAAEQELDLRVEAAQIIVRPPLDGLQQGRIDTKQERFPISH
jgi:hypothetical protein